MQMLMIFDVKKCKIELNTEYFKMLIIFFFDND